MTNPEDIRNRLEAAASALGFDMLGIAPAQPLDDQTTRYKEWVRMGYNAGMGYMERNIEKRLNPCLVVENARSVIVTALNYYHDYPLEKNKPRFARYSLGDDYHKVVKDKLYILASVLKEENPSCSFRVFVDSAPVKENVWAVMAGLGWIGRNSLLINKSRGSYFVLGEIITDAEITNDYPFDADHCGTCRMCIDSCPNCAINENRTLDASKCISYLTIEHNGDFKTEQERMTGNHLFGCDICQEVCPWNSKSKESDVPEFSPKNEITNHTLSDWEKLTPDEFEKLFNGSPVLRTGYKGFRRNVKAARGGSEFE